MTPYELMSEAVRLAEEAVRNGWGGPFGAVIARDGVIVARGANRVLLTGDVTAHAEIEAIRKAVDVLNPYAPAIPEAHQNESTLELVDSRAKMLQGFEMYTTGQPCPMCIGAIYWARLDACYFGCDVEMTRKIGFDDAFIYDELRQPPEQRRIPFRQAFPELCEGPYRAWMERPDRHYY